MNKIKKFIKNNPEKVKVIGAVSGAVIGLAVVAVIVYSQGTPVPELPFDPDPPIPAVD